MPLLPCNRLFLAKQKVSPQTRNTPPRVTRAMSNNFSNADRPSKRLRRRAVDDIWKELETRELDQTDSAFSESEERALNSVEAPSFSHQYPARAAAEDESPILAREGESGGHTDEDNRQSDSAKSLEAKALDDTASDGSDAAVPTEFFDGPGMRDLARTRLRE